MGLIALAVSDLLYCLFALPDAFLRKEQTTIFYHKYFLVYVQLYGKCFQNLFSHTSTWLTVIIAVGRYAAICHPLHARQFVHAKGMRAAIVMTFLLWTGLVLPCFWSYKIESITCPNDNGNFNIHILDNGVFIKNKTLKTTFSYVWTIIGYFIPVCVLAFCNAYLIRALRESYRMRQEYRVHGQSQQPGSHITPTLVAIVIMFIVFVSPSEIIQFVFYTVKGSQAEGLILAITVTNLLHTLNFASNFVLYCVVNVHFRATLRDVFYCIIRKEPRRRISRQYTASYSNVTSRSFGGGSNAATTSTVI